MAKYVIISGSTRKNSQSAKVSQYLAKQMEQIGSNEDSAQILDLSHLAVPFWNEDLGREKNPQWEEVSKELQVSAGVIFVVPEWNGMAPPALMNLFLLANKGEFSHKPALIVAVSAGNGGAYVVSQLRSYGYKNCQLLYIPDHVIIRTSMNVLNGEEAKDPNDQYIRDRIKYSLKVFFLYCNSLMQIRESKEINLEQYPNGM